MISKNVTLYPTYKLGVTVKYYLNEGDADPYDEKFVINTEDLRVDPPDPSDVPWGKEFVCWGEAGVSGCHVGVPAIDKKLYAHWKAKVTYNGNGGSGGATADPHGPYVINSTVTVLGKGGWVKPGYNFSGWNTAADGLGTPYAAGGSLTIVRDTTLYAQWTAIPYTVTYNGNGNTDGVGPTQSGTFTIGSTVSVKGKNTLKKTGHFFAGWNTKEDGTGDSYVEGSPLTVPAGNVVLYAKWQEGATYKVRYSDMGMSTSGSAPVDNNEYGAGEKVYVLMDYGTLERTGFVPSGWCLQKDTGVDSTVGTSCLAMLTGAGGSLWFEMPDYNVVIFIKYDIISSTSFSVAYFGNGQDYGEPPIDENSPYNLEETVTVLGAGSLKKDGYTLSGWKIVDTWTETKARFLLVGSKFTIWRPRNLYARWLPNITLEAQGGTLVGEISKVVPERNTDDSIRITNATVGKIEAYFDVLPAAPTRAGYSFDGWYLSEDGTDKVSAGKNGTKFTEPTTLYAHWTAIPYTVTYDGNGGTGSVTADPSNPYVFNSTVTVLGQGDWVNEGSVFKGWNTVAGGTGTAYSEDEEFEITENVTLYAQWKAIVALTEEECDEEGYYLYGTPKSCHETAGLTVTYNGNGGTGDVPVDENSPYVAGYEVTVLDKGEDLSKSGSIFKGCTFVADGSGDTLWEDDVFNIDAHKTLYAQWKEIATIADSTDCATEGYYWLWDGSTQSCHESPDYYKVTYNANGGTETVTDSKKYAPGATVTVLGQGDLSKSGSIFKGWNTVAGGSGTAYSENEEFEISESVTLYAQWKEIATIVDSTDCATEGYYWLWDGSTQSCHESPDYYKITYNANGGEGDEPEDEKEYAPGATVTVLGQGDLSKADSVFTGWNAAANGSGTPYAAGGTLLIYTDTTLFAQWKAVKDLDEDECDAYDLTWLWDGATQSCHESPDYYTVTYNANGGTGSVADSKEYAPGATVTVLGQGELAKSGSIFKGWKDGSGTARQAGSTFAISKNETLSAQWKAIVALTEEECNEEGYSWLWDGATPSCHVSPTAYTVTYNANGGTGTVTDSKKYAPGATVTVLGQGGLSKSGSIFKGWKNESGTERAVGATFTISESETLLAQWKAVEDLTVEECAVKGYNWYGTPKSCHSVAGLTVTYSGNGGTGAVPTDANSPYVPGSTVTVLGKGGLLKSGSVFKGWNTAANGTGTVRLADSTFTLSGNVTLYAQWKAIVKLDSVECADFGYSWLWDGATQSCHVSPAAYTVTYDANGGNDDVPVDSKQYAPGAAVTVLGKGDLAKSGSLFKGWNTVASGNGAARPAGSTFTLVESVTLYAQWKDIAQLDSAVCKSEGYYWYGSPKSCHEAEGLTVAYNANGGVGEVPADSNTYAPGATVTVFGKGDLAKSGSVFYGWNTFARGNGAARQAGSTFTLVESVTLYAQWKTITQLDSAVCEREGYYWYGGSPRSCHETAGLTVTYNGNGGTGSVPVDSRSPYAVGSTVTVLGKGGLSKAGSVFAGWEDGSGTARSAGSKFKIVESVTLYARWKDFAQLDSAECKSEGYYWYGSPKSCHAEAPVYTLDCSDWDWSWTSQPITIGNSLGTIPAPYCIVRENDDVMADPPSGTFDWESPNAVLAASQTPTVIFTADKPVSLTAAGTVEVTAVAAPTVTPSVTPPVVTPAAPTVAPPDNAGGNDAVRKRNGRLTIGPSPVKIGGEQKVFWSGSSPISGDLIVYNGSGGQIASIPVYGTGQVGKWTVGRGVPTGSYLVAGSVSEEGGRTIKVSILVGVVR